MIIRHQKFQEINHKTAGRRITVAAGESFQVKRCEELETSLDHWMEE